MTRAELSRITKALETAGYRVAAVDVRPDGSFRVITTEAKGLMAETEDEKLDREGREFRAKHGHGTA